MVSYLATATVAATLLAATPQQAQWETDYGKALEATRADNRPLLVVLDDPAEQPVRAEQVSLSDPAAAAREAELMKNYHLCHVDVSSEYGQRVAKAFGVKAFPYTVIIDKTGSVIIYTKTGRMKGNEWETTLAANMYGDREDLVAISSQSGTTNVSHSNSTCTTCQNGYCPTCQNGSCATGNCPTGNCPTGNCPTCQQGY